MDDHPIHDDSMQEIVESFVVEATEIYDGLEGDLLQLEKRPDDSDLVDEIFRDVHTVKGTAGFLSLDQLSTLAHRFEEVLDAMRGGAVDVEPAMTDVLLCAFDHMKALTQQVIDRDLQSLELAPLLEALSDITDGTFDPDDVTLPRIDTAAETGASAPAPDASPPDTADADVSSPDASSGDTGASPASPNASPRSSNASGGTAPDTIRVDVRRLNRLMDLVGELVLGRNRLLQLISDLQSEHSSAPASKGSSQPDRLRDLLDELDDASDKVDFTTSELQGAVMRTRMVQIGQVFDKFPRVVRDLAQEFEKDITLVVEGKDTELDKSLVEEIGDPLTHLIRNAADHGIEPPEVRKQHGKDPQGEIRLSAFHAGNHIVVEVADDGAGLDPDALRAKAVERDLLTEADAEDLTDTEAHQLIFRPGFTTTEEASQVSGRGVGMDVVKTNLSELNGTIDIDSTPGEGTCFRLKIPLTLAILESMLVRSGPETFALPLYAVSEVVRLTPQRVDSIQGSDVIRHRDRVVPLLRLRDVLSVPLPASDTVPASPDRAVSNAYAVIVTVAHRRVALVVDEPIAQEEVVIKSLGNYLKGISGIAGSTILGDGRVIMVLDVGELIQMEDAAVAGTGPPRGAPPSAAASLPAPSTP